MSSSRDVELQASAATSVLQLLLRRPELQQATSYAIRCMGSSSERAAAMVVGDSQIVKLLAALLLLPGRPGCTPAALDTAGTMYWLLKTPAAAPGEK